MTQVERDHPHAREAVRVPSAIMSVAAYQSFVVFMFAAIMVNWGTTLLRVIKNIWESSARNKSHIGEMTLTAIQSVSFQGWVNVIVGLVLGVALAHLYWTYAEKLVPEHPPRHLAIFSIDFLLLTVLMIAAGMWDSPLPLSVLAIVAFMIFGARLLPIWRTDKLYKSLFWLSMGFVAGIFVLVAVAILWRVASSEPDSTLDIKVQPAWLVGSLCVLTGLGTAIGFVWQRSRRHQPEDVDKQFPRMYFDPTPSRLIPAYWAIDPQLAARVIQGVRDGEETFLRLIKTLNKNAKAGQILRHHQSGVHSYVDVETQAFIVCLSAPEPRDMKWYSLWVYLAHWLDDIIDSKGGGRVELSDLVGESALPVEELLNRIHPSAKEAWILAVSQTSQSCPNWKQEYAARGVERLVMSALMNAVTRRREDRAEARVIYRRQLLDQVKPDDAPESHELLCQMTADELAMTSKVTFDFWEAFRSPADDVYCLLLSILYSPGLALHDHRKEEEAGEISSDPIVEARALLDKRKNALAAALRKRDPERARSTASVARVYELVFKDVLAPDGIGDSFSDLVGKLK